MNPETRALLELSLLPKLGRQRLQTLLGAVGSGEAILQLSDEELRGLRVPLVARKVLRGGLATRLAEEAIEKAAGKQVRIISRADKEFPALLKEIADPPAVLYVRGSISLLKRSSIALVGSRKCSAYGSEISLQLARELARYGLTLVSGLARGIDSKAHLGALEAGGTTVAVLGCGVDIVYPRENQRLYERILEEGCLVSEFPLESYPAPQNFPVRNRIISGLCLGTIIAEASRFSGSLITARLTLEQDRELWAIPGFLTNPGSFGPNHLIKQGAHILLTAQDVLDQLRPDVLQELLAGGESEGSVEESEKRGKQVDAVRLDSHEKAVLQLLDVHCPRHIDELAESSRLPPAELNHVLFSLELRGLVRQAPGRRFHRRLL